VNNQELCEKVRSATAEILNTSVVISTVNLLIKIGMLKQKDYEDWRMGRVPYLEKICTANLNKLIKVLKELRKIARENNLKSSKTVYKKWGKGEKTLLRFSKYKNHALEEAYSTHFVNSFKAAEQKQNEKGVAKEVSSN
jgi:hypothetical protein